MRSSSLTLEFRQSPVFLANFPCELGQIVILTIIVLESLHIVLSNRARMRSSCVLFIIEGGGGRGGTISNS